MIRVLIVDDDKLARAGLANTIDWAKYDMEVIGQAANGKKALEIIAGNQVDLAFVDIGMPVMNGIELMRECRTSYPNVQFVVLSFHEDFDYVQEALRLGVIDYISKEQTEMDDYGSIMERIVARLGGLTDDSGMDSDEVKKLDKLLEGVLWIYDNMQFEAVLKAAEACSHNIRAAERVLVAEISHAHTLTKVEPYHFKAINNVKELIEALSQAREYLIRGILGQRDSSYSRMMVTARTVWEKYNTSINSSDIADEIGLSRSHFSIMFQKTVGIQFNVFVRRERVLNACRLIRTTDLSQMNIADKVGYMDIKNYNSAFQSIMMCSPGEYRSTIKKLS